MESEPTPPASVYLNVACPFASVIAGTAKLAFGPPFAMVKYTIAPAAGAWFESVAVAVNVWVVPTGFVADAGASARFAAATGVETAGPTPSSCVPGFPFWSAKRFAPGARARKKSPVPPAGVIVVTSNITVIEWPGARVIRLVVSGALNG